MLYIPCPYCQESFDEAEFYFGGEAHRIPPFPAASDREWADYLFMRQNSPVAHRERWLHVHGCRRWFNVIRDTTSSEIVDVYPMGKLPVDRTRA